MYNNGFPMAYPQMNYGMQQPQADIGQVNSEQDAVNAYVAAGRSRIMFTPDDKTVFVKCVSMNGQVTMDIFDRRIQEAAPAAPEYVTKEDLAKAIEELKKTKEAAK